jgi:biopolymer transport protein ExbB/TolQ
MEWQGALRRSADVSPFVGVTGTVVGIVTAFQLIDRGASDVDVVYVGFSVTVVTTLLLTVLVLVGALVIELALSPRAK